GGIEPAAVPVRKVGRRARFFPAAGKCSARNSGAPGSCGITRDALSRTPVWPATRRRRTNMRITRQVSKGVLLLGLLQAGIHAAQAAEACAGYDDLPTTLELDAGLQHTLQL